MNLPFNVSETSLFFQILILIQGSLKAALSPVVKLLVLFCCQLHLQCISLRVCPEHSQSRGTELHFTVPFEYRWRDELVGAYDNGVHAHSGCISVLAFNLEQKSLLKDKMNKKRHFLEAPEVKDYLVKGERFTKWSEVSKYFKKICAGRTVRFYFLLSDVQHCKFCLI